MKLSRIFKEKTKFFIFRMLGHFSLLLIPTLLPQFFNFKQAPMAFMIFIYIMFLATQWFLLGKEIDNRFKIYIKFNSSIDKMVYRLLLGHTAMILFFGVLSLFPWDAVIHVFWGTWVALGLFYSWPTRGKIIQETVSTHFQEFRFLDAFEKTIAGLIIFLFVISLPALPAFEGVEATKLVFDPHEGLGGIFWNFLGVNFLPFIHSENAMRLAVNLYFYIFGLGIFLCTFYAVLRHFVSRRLSLLGIFALLSAWPYSKILMQSMGASITATYSILWVWAILWVSKSGTYRAGLLVGLLAFWGVIINISFAFLMPLLLGLIIIFMSTQNDWHRLQFLKYTLFGLVLMTFFFIINFDAFDGITRLSFKDFTDALNAIFARKAFFVLAPLGVVLTILRFIPRSEKFVEEMELDKEKLIQMLSCYALFLLFAFMMEASFMESYAIMWLLTFFSLLPLHWIFQAISRLRSKRNMIYVAYILICLLDSHIEGRIKIFVKLFHA